MNTKEVQKRIAKMTSKGQITLPAAWRKHIDTSHVLIETKGDVLEIRSAHIDTDEYTVFDAIRDNKGKGIKAADLIRIMSDIDK